jgi:hypothetical protein
LPTAALATAPNYPSPAKRDFRKLEILPTYFPTSGLFGHIRTRTGLQAPTEDHEAGFVARYLHFSIARESVLSSGCRPSVSEIPLRLCLIQTQFTAADLERIVLLLKNRDDLIESEDQPGVETSLQ